MRKVRLSPKALEDLEEIFDYTVRKWTYTQAEIYHATLFDALNSIRENPDLGRNYPFHGREYKRFKVNRHLIFYSYSSDFCDIIRILHERMDLNRYL